MRVFALLPAAGKSVRMGCPKLSLPLGESTVLEHVLHGLALAGIRDRLVVVGPHVSELTTLCQRTNAHVCLLDEPTPDMRATIERGLTWLTETFHPKDDDAWLLIPADHPTLRTDVVRQLTKAYRNSSHSIVVPTYQGQRGHPVLIRWGLVAGLRDHPPEEGLNTYLRKHAADRLEVPVEYEEVLWDLDTPEDYERLRRWWKESRE